MAQEQSPYRDARYCKAQLLHALAKYVHNAAAEQAGLGRNPQNGTSGAHELIKHLPVGTVLKAICKNKTSFALPFFGTISAQGVQCCSNPSHVFHPICDWPGNCAGVLGSGGTKSNGGQQKPDAQHAQPKITITQLPVHFVNDNIKDTQERKQLLKQHLNVDIQLEDLQTFLKVRMNGYGEYHLLGCHHCNKVLSDRAVEGTKLPNLVCCSGCRASFHADSACLGPYGMKSPCEYENLDSESIFPHSGCGDLWLCPLCCERLAPKFVKPSKTPMQGGAANQPAQLPCPHLTKALVIISATDASILPVSVWRKRFCQYPGYRGYLSKFITKEEAYRHWLQGLGLQLPGWLEPLLATNHATQPWVLPEAAAPSGTMPTPQQPDVCAPPEDVEADNLKATAVSLSVAPLHGQPAIQVVTPTVKRQPSPSDAPPAKRLCIGPQSSSHLHLWPLVLDLLTAFKPVMQFKAGTSSTKPHTNQVDEFDHAAAALLQKAWSLKAAGLSQAMTSAIKEAADDMKEQGDDCQVGTSLTKTALRLQGALAERKGPAAATAAPEVGAFALLCSDSMAAMTEGEGNHLLQAWRVLTTLSALHPVLAEAVTNAGATSSADTSGGLHERLEIFQDAIAMLLAALLSNNKITNS